MLLKKPKSLILQEHKQREAEAESKRRLSKRKRTVARYTIDDAEDCDRSDDSDFGDDEPGSKRRITLGDLSNSGPVKNMWPLSRITKDYDAMAVLSKKFKVPTINGEVAPEPFGARRTLGLRRRPGVSRSLYDPNADDAIILWDPAEEQNNENDENEGRTSEEEEKPQDKIKVGGGGKSLSEILGLKKEKRKKTHVIVDPVLARILRPHQIEGLKFLYRCTTGKVHPDAYGYVCWIAF